MRNFIFYIFAGLKHTKTFVFLCALSVCSYSFSNDSSFNADSVLNNLHKIKSSNATELKNGIDYLESKYQYLTGSQKNELKYFQAYRSFVLGDASEAVSKGIDIINTSKDTDLLVRIHILLGTASLYSRDWELGLTSLLFISSSLDRIENENLVQTASIFVAFFYVQSRQFENATDYLDAIEFDNLTVRNKCIWNQLYIESLINKTNTSIPKKMVDEAVYLCKSSNEEYMATILKGYYVSSFVDSDPTMVINETQKLLNNLPATGIDIIKPGLYSLLARAYYNAGMLEDSLNYAQLSLNYKDSPGSTKDIIKVYYVLYEIYSKRKSYKLALDYYIEYSEKNNIYLTELEARDYSLKLSQYKFDEVKRENKNLIGQNALLKLEQKLTQSEKENQQLFIVLLGTCLILLTAYLYKARQNQIRLKQLAEFDALTGAHNRGHFTQLAKSALQFAQDSKQSVAVVLFDLDLFKKVNDTYGHACGDWVLKQVAGVCQELTRKNDVFARVGGEEFCFLLLGCDSHTALDVAEKCRRAIYGIDTRKSGFDFKVSGSFGVSDNQLSGYDLDRILADADEALYCSKSSGRNTVSLYDPGAEQTALLRPDGSPAT